MPALRGVVAGAAVAAAGVWARAALVRWLQQRHRRLRPRRGQGAPVVLQVLPALNELGGVERGTVDVARHLAQAGCKSVVVSAGGPLVEQLARPHAVHVEVRSISSKNPVMMLLVNPLRLWRICAQHNVEVIHARSRAVGWSAWVVCRLLSARPLALVTTFHSKYGRNMFSASYNAVMTMGDAVVVPSYFIAHHVMLKYASSAAHVSDLRARMVVIRRGVDLAEFDPACVSTARRNALFRGWGIEHDPTKRYVVMAARPSRLKGHAHFADALIALEDPALVGLIVGIPSPKRERINTDGRGLSDYLSLLRHFIAQARQAGITIHVLPPCRDMAALYSLANVVVIPSTRPEGHGRIATEAMAMGCPVVAFDHGGVQESFEELGQGWPADPDDLASLPLQILRAVHMRPSRADQTALRAKISASYSSAGMGAEYQSVYRDVAG